MIDGSNMRAITRRGSFEQPLWSLSGEKIAVSARIDEPHYRIYVMNADGRRSAAPPSGRSERIKGNGTLQGGSGPRRRDEAELFEHREPIEHQVERDMLPIPEAQHLDISDPDGASGRRDVPRRSVKDAVVSAAECTLLDGHVVEDVKVVHIDMCVRKGAEPAAEEFSASFLALSAQPTRRCEDDIVREQRCKPL
jgi:hypothetical protein